MNRLLEYVYLIAGIGVAVFMALEWKHLNIANKIGLCLAAMLCAFMYSFRKKQREMMDALQDKEEAEESETTDPEEDGR